MFSICLSSNSLVPGQSGRIPKIQASFCLHVNLRLASMLYENIRAKENFRND